MIATNYMVFTFSAQAVGAFAQLINTLEAATSRKDRAKYTTMVSGFVRSLHFVRTADSIEGNLVRVRKNLNVKTGEVNYDFTFETAERKPDAKDL